MFVRCNQVDPINKQKKCMLNNGSKGCFAHEYDDVEFSYAHNCTIQERIFTRMNRPMIESAIKSLISDNVIKPSQVLKIADLGCGIGPIPTNLISLVTTTVSMTCEELKLEDNRVSEIQIFLSDLPTNDFNSSFRSLERFQLLEQDFKRPSCFVVGVPGSFYGRLFPGNSLHFVQSNYALQCLSQVPFGVYDEEGISKNKGSITVSETSSPDVVQSYSSQYQQDFNLFLRCRANEVVPNGYMLLALKGSPSMEPQESCTTKLLYQALASLVSKKLDSFALPLYFPAKEEIQIAVTKDGSFTIEKLQQIVNYASDEIEDRRRKLKPLLKQSGHSRKPWCHTTLEGKSGINCVMVCIVGVMNTIVSVRSYLNCHDLILVRLSD